jgi:hypothetical protein
MLYCYFFIFFLFTYLFLGEPTSLIFERSIHIISFTGHSIGESFCVRFLGYWVEKMGKSLTINLKI